MFGTGNCVSKLKHQTTSSDYMAWTAMAMPTPSVPSEFPKENCHGSKRCQECPILTSVHSSQRRSQCLRIAQAPLNTPTFHFYFSTNSVCRKGVSCSNNMTLAIVNKFFYGSCILQYLRHVPFFTCPFLPGYSMSVLNKASNASDK